MEKQKVTGIVLAGGKSSRMGTDKSLMMLHGKTMIQHAIDIISPFCEKVVISSGNFVYDFTGCEVLPDILPVQAPIIGIYSCLKQSESDVNIVISCDMPFIPTSLIELLLSNAPKYDVVVPMHDNFLEPLCGIYKKSILPMMERYILNQTFKLHEFIRNSNYLAMTVSENLLADNTFSNINTIEDFNKIDINSLP